jgi:transposase
MVRAYSLDLRTRAVACVESGASIRAASKRFEIHESTLSLWLRQKRERGHLLPEKTGSKGKRKIDYDNLCDYVDKNNDATLEEIGKIFSVSPSAVHKALRKRGFTYKKKRRSMPSGMKKSVRNL